MKPTESFLGRPILSLQTMLRVIGENEPELPALVPDGIYSTDTTRAVATFQRQKGLPATGITDQATWEAIVTAYELARIEQDAAQSLQIILNPGQVIHSGEQHPNIYLTQAVLTVLAEAYASVLTPSFTGVLDLPTQESLSSFQTLVGMPATGELDKNTWRHLALHYPLAAAPGQRSRD